MKTSNDFFLGHDLAMLSLANISVLTYGTFGLWGAFLGNVEEIIVSQHMFKETKEGYELKEANLSNVVVLWKLNVQESIIKNLQDTYCVAAWRNPIALSYQFLSLANIDNFNISSFDNFSPPLITLYFPSISIYSMFPLLRNEVEWS